MTQENSEPQLSFLNPLYLKAAREEAHVHPKAVPKEQEETSPASPPQAKARETEPPEPFGGAGRDDGSAVNQSGLASALEASKAAIASKQAEIARVREEIDRLSNIKDSERPTDLNVYQAELNELRLRRIAIQMALISGSGEYVDGDIAALDGKISEQLKLIAQARVPDAASTKIDAALNVKIDRLRSEMESMTRELSTLVADHNHRAVVRRAEAYIKALKTAHRLQHELLALAALGPGDGPLKDLDFGGALPVPWGFETFASILPGDLAITVEGIEEAKARLGSEVVSWPT